MRPKVKKLAVWDNDIPGNIEPLLQQIARTSYKKDSTPVTEEGASKFLKTNVLGRFHTTLIEHCWFHFFCSQWYWNQISISMSDTIRHYLNIKDFIFIFKNDNGEKTNEQEGVCISANALTWLKFCKEYGKLEILDVFLPTIFSKNVEIATYNNSDLIFIPPNQVPKECIAYTWKVEGASRGFTHEMVRHRRNIVFTQQSTRYVDESNFNFRFPPGITDYCFKGQDIDKRDIVEHLKILYNQLREQGMKPQDARQFLPIGIEAPIAMTMNHEAYEHMIKLRHEGITGPPHWEIKEVMDRLLETM